MRVRTTLILAIITTASILGAPTAGHAQDTGSPSNGLPAVIPIFPLPDTGLFPNASHGFHIFEPRYRAMIADALKGNRTIGMVMLQPGFESDYEGRPPIFPIGTAGLITEYEMLPDGRYNILLGGLVKFHVTGEDQGQPYRLAHVTALPELLTAQQTTALRNERQRIDELLGTLVDDLGIEPSPSGMPDEQVVDELAQLLPMPKPDRYALLVLGNPLERGRAIVELLEAMLKTVRAPQ
jgi:Lon protease-like protein